MGILFFVMKITLKVLSFVLFIFIASCSKNEVEEENITLVIPTVITKEVTNLKSYSVTFNAELVNEGSAGILSRGFCWSFNSNPTIGDKYTEVDGSGVGHFFKDFSDLKPNTTYHLRAFVVTNYDNKVYYGNDIIFTTL